MTRLTASLLGLSLLAVPACKKEEPPPLPPPTAAPAPATTLPAPVAVAGVTLGNAIGADKRVTAPAETFAPRDTIYAAVETTGSGPARLRALWTFVRGAQTAKVDETTVQIDATGPAVSEFHVSKPGGWPKGDYKVEIFLGDAAAPSATRTFKVN
jgi:hypothetical protein